MLKGKGCTGGPDKPSAGNDKIFSCPALSASCPSASRNDRW